MDALSTFDKGRWLCHGPKCAKIITLRFVPNQIGTLGQIPRICGPIVRRHPIWNRERFRSPETGINRQRGICSTEPREVGRKTTGSDAAQAGDLRSSHSRRDPIDPRVSPVDPQTFPPGASRVERTREQFSIWLVTSQPTRRRRPGTLWPMTVRPPHTCEA